MKAIIKFYVLALIGILLITASCSTSESDDPQSPQNCDCTKYTITVTTTPVPNPVITEDVIEEPWCGEETPYRIFIGTNGAYNYQTRIDMYYEIKCGANQY